MFKKLQHLQKTKSDTKNKQSSYAQRSANKQRMEQPSYSRMHKVKRVVPSQLLNFHVTCNDYYIYQGQWVGEFRNGEGIAFFKNGCLVVGHWHKDLLHGRSLIFTPFGAMISATFINGKLNGWVLAQYRNKIVLANLYFEDRIDGPRIMFEGSQDFWMASTINNQGQLIKISHVEKGTRDRLPLFVQNDDLSQLFNEIVTKKNYSFDFQKIKTINIAAQTNYIGFIDNQSLPSGLGGTYSESQCFVGYYDKGFLEQIGRMIFANGDIYHGGLSAGGFAGHGVYYNPNKNNTMVIRSQAGQQAQILQQQIGYYLVDFELKVGEKLSKDDKIVFSPTIQSLMKTLEKYYHQYYIEARIKQQEEYSNQSERHSQNLHMKDVESEQNHPHFIKSNTRWIANNDNQSAISQEMSLNGEKQLKLNFQTKGFYSPKTKIQTQFNSISIKENEEPEQKEKFNKHNPKVNQYKKGMFLNEQQLKLQATKSLDVNQLTFRGPAKNSESPVKNPKKQGKQYPEYFQLEEERNYHEAEYPSPNSSSSISQMDEKLSGMMKRSNFRRKIFQ